MLPAFGWPAGLNFLFPYFTLREFYGFSYEQERTEEFVSSPVTEGSIYRTC